jgi:mannonate dehydratase
MAFEQTWRWFGPSDPVLLSEIKQTGATGIVTALHQIPIGEIWSIDEITKRKQIIEAAGLTWSVVESLPIHENIKKRKGNYQQLIGNYKTSLQNLGKCGIDIVCYNFMPVLDWSRTDLSVVFRDGTITSRFEIKALVAFDLFLLKRPDAEKDYTVKELHDAKNYFELLNDKQKEYLSEVILLGLPGSLDALTPKELQAAFDEYKEIGKFEFQDNLSSFLKEVVPIAEESGVLLAIHPDDPPRSLFGLPRIVGNSQDLQMIVNAIDSVSNGITFCTGSLGAGYNNDCVALAQQFAYRTNFIHLRNVWRNIDGDFLEENHLDGDVDMYGVMKALLIEQNKRKASGRKDFRMPFRPDHGHLMLDDINTRNYYPGYSLYGRMKGLAELRGLELGIRKELHL